MTPKLEEIFNTPITLLLGGSLWGIWHFSDSFLGAGCKLSGEFWFLLFNKCILCIAMGAVLTWLTKKTKTVITSSIAHAIFNNISGVMPIFFISEDSIKESDKMVLSAILLVPMIIFGVIAGVLISRDKKKELSE